MSNRTVDIVCNTNSLQSKLCSDPTCHRNCELQYPPTPPCREVLSHAGRRENPLSPLAPSPVSFSGNLALGRHANDFTMQRIIRQKTPMERASTVALAFGTTTTYAENSIPTHNLFGQTVPHGHMLPNQKRSLRVDRSSTPDWPLAIQESSCSALPGQCLRDGLSFPCSSSVYRAPRRTSF